MKWMIAGGEAVVKIYAGAAHGFIVFPPKDCKEAAEGLKDCEEFINDCLGE